jgi:hypothetical protein
MNVRIIRTSLAIIALILVGAAWAQAEPSNVQIKFKFIAGSKMLDAGNYAVDLAGDKVVLTPEGGGAALELAPVKNLGRKKVSKLELVFEEVGSTMYLSEVWVPEKDGVKVSNVDASERRQTVSPKAKK